MLFQICKNRQQTCQLENQLNQLVAQQIDKQKCEKTFTFQKSMIKHRDHLFTFLYDLEVPLDNNTSEIRNIKVKQKIVGQFKSGQHNFCKLSSVMYILRKRKLDVFFFLKAMLSIQLQKSPE